jgi:hypothetical protein
MAGWFIPAALILLLVYAFAGGVQAGLQQLSVWVLWTSCLAAVFTALSLAHPLSILTSFVAAPFTTLHPLLACGWFTGLVEAVIKKPTVADVQNVSQDIFSIKGFYRNRLLRTLLVIFMANLGAHWERLSPAQILSGNWCGKKIGYPQRMPIFHSIIACRPTWSDGLKVDGRPGQQIKQILPGTGSSVAVFGHFPCSTIFVHHHHYI